jgi:hypothetical protein
MLTIALGTMIAALLLADLTVWEADIVGFAFRLSTDPARLESCTLEKVGS